MAFADPTIFVKLAAGFRRAAWAIAPAILMLAAAPVSATVIQASLYTPIAPGGANLVRVAAPATGSASGSGVGYSLLLDTAASQGVVNGSSSGQYAAPVAGVLGGSTPQYLTGGFGSALTTSLAASGNYFSTGQAGAPAPGTVTVNFATAQNALALLWGSIDAGNQITFRNGSSSTTVYGQEILNAVPGVVAASQTAGGSAYVMISGLGNFTSATFSSSVTSFEFAGVVGSNVAFVVPEPISLGLLGVGIAAIVAVRRRR